VCTCNPILDVEPGESPELAGQAVYLIQTKKKKKEAMLERQLGRKVIGEVM
jgi:hypothetical protein